MAVTYEEAQVEMREAMRVTVEEHEANVAKWGMPTRAVAQRRYQVLHEEWGFRIGGKAQYALFESCYMPGDMPEALKALSKLISHFEVDCSLLPNPRCCGSNLSLKAQQTKDEVKLKRARELQIRNIREDVEQAKAMGAKTLVYVCAGCEAVFSRFKEELDFDVIWYTELIDRFFTGGKLELKADFYAGCYAYNNLMGSFPNLESSYRILQRIKGLEVNYLPQRLCCVRRNELESIAHRVKSGLVVNICHHCNRAVDDILKEQGKGKSIMLPEVCLQSIQ